MKALDKLPKHHSNDGYLHRVCIPCIYNGGRRATIRATVGRPDIIHISIDTDSPRPYQRGIDSYLHLDTDKINKWLAIDPTEPIMGHYRQEAEEIIEMIRGINIHYFAGTLTVLSDDKAIVDRSIPRKRTLKIVVGEMIAAYKDYTQSTDIGWLFGEESNPKFWRTLPARIRYSLSKIKRQHDRIEQVVPLADAHLGASWQRYYPEDAKWLEEAETLKGGRIYLT